MRGYRLAPSWRAMFPTANMAFPRLHDASASASQRRFVQVDSLPTIACAGLVTVAVDYEALTIAVGLSPG
jgi:hypothetical protein